tara:strand:+ start:2321 stop:4027 length:1707 start_codon:yes stop_codon:yes gene_type:complete
MANTYVDYTGDGTQDTFSITFPFLSNPHVIVKVADVTKTEGTHYNITSGNVVFTSGNEPASAAAVRIQRETEKTSPLVDFKDGSTLLEADLDTATRQSFYISQETDENALRKSGTDWDATSLKITNLGTPTADADASTKSYVDTQVAAKDALSELSGTLDDLTEGTTNKHFTATDNTKLDGIETGATADQTDAEIRTAVDNATDSNVFTDADRTKLDGIESGAKVNVQSDWDASSGDAQILNKPTVPSALNDLSNVDASPSDGQVLKWVDASSEWQAGDDSGGSGGGSGDITRVNITAGTGLSGTQDTTTGDHTQTLAVDVGIADDKIVQVDGTPDNNEYARWTPNGLEGRVAADVLTDIGASASSHNHDSAYAAASHNHDSDYQPLDSELTTLAALTEARGSIIVGNSTPEWDTLALGAANKVLTSDGADAAWAALPAEIGIACSDETSALSTGEKATVMVPKGMTIKEVKASLTEAGSSSSVVVNVMYHASNPNSATTSLFATSNALTIASGAYKANISTFTDGSGGTQSTYTAAEDSFLVIEIPSSYTPDSAARGLKVWVLGEWS